MKRFFARGLVVVAGVVSLPGPTPAPTAQQAPAPGYRQDPRFNALGNFFRKFDCPALPYTHVFLEAADLNLLDWRLLPSISYVESTCGKQARNNNIFGWDSGRAQFPSTMAAIQSVAHRLTHSRRYRNRTVDEILAVYNSRTEYARTVKSVMRQIAVSQ